MAKASIKLLKSLTGRSSSEISHVITAIQFQQESGIIKYGIDHSVTAIETAMCERHSYNCIRSLTTAGIYQIADDRSIYIPANDFSKGFDKNNYIELPNFMHSSQFHYAPVQVKRLVINLLICRTKYQYTKLTAVKMMQWLNLNRLSKLLDVLRKLSEYGWFSMVDQREVVDDRLVFKYLFKLKKYVTGTSRYKHNRASEHQIRRILKKKRISYTPKTLADFTQLYNQYKEGFIKALRFLDQSTAKGSIFRMIISQCIAYKQS